MEPKYSSGSIQKHKDVYRGMLRYQDGNGEWKTVSKVFNTTSKREAKKKLYKWKMDLEQLAILESETEEIDNRFNETTIREYLNDLLDKQSKFKQVEKSTIAGYQSLINLISRYIGETKVLKVTPEIVEDMMLNMLEDHLSANTVKKCHARLKFYLNKLVMDGYLDKNPCERVKPPRYEPPERATLSTGERLRLINAIDNMRENRLTIAVRIALNTGMRRGEICGLKWTDVSLPENNDGIINIQVRNSIGVDKKGTEYLKGTKSGHKRDIPVKSAELAAALKRRRYSMIEQCFEYGVEFKPNTFILGDIEGNQYPVDSLSKEFKHLRDLIDLRNINDKPATFHELRHTYATEAIAANIDVETVAAILGHSDPSLTLKVYGKAKPEAKLQAASRMGEIMNKKPQSSRPIPFMRKAQGE